MSSPAAGSSREYIKVTSRSWRALIQRSAQPRSLVANVGPTSARKLHSQLLLENPRDDRRCAKSPRIYLLVPVPISMLESKTWLGAGWGSGFFFSLISSPPLLMPADRTSGDTAAVTKVSALFVARIPGPVPPGLGLWGVCEVGAI